MTPTGTLDHNAAESFRRDVQSLIRRGTSRVVVDLSAVDAADSAFLGVLVACRATAREAGGDLVIAGAGGKVKAMLSLSGLSRILTCYESAEAASVEVVAQAGQ